MLALARPGTKTVRRAKSVRATGRGAVLISRSLMVVCAGNFRFATLSTPRGLAVNEDEPSLYLADSGNHAVRRLALRSGEVKTLAGGSGAGIADGVGRAAKLNTPLDVALSADARQLYVVDSFRLSVVDTLTGAHTPTHSFPSAEHGRSNQRYTLRRAIDDTCRWYRLELSGRSAWRRRTHVTGGSRRAEPVGAPSHRRRY